ncbi:DUF2071 domain-containing protein [Humibacter soli]
MSAVGTLKAQLRRRLLVSYAVDPSVATRLLPEPFRPQLVGDRAVGGFCMIGLQSVRPGWFPSSVGIRTENAAHRMAVEWSESGRTRYGVYIFERHSSSLFPVAVGGRLFPGVQRHARFELDETEARFRVEMDAPDTYALADVELSESLSSSLFTDIDAASAFYRDGAIGWSPRRDGRGVEPIELVSQAWAVEPGHIHEVRSSFFDSLPAGAVELDSALVMRNMPLTWDVPRALPVTVAVRPNVAGTKDRTPAG